MLEDSKIDAKRKTIQVKSAKEAKEHFSLDVSIKTIDNWCKQFGVGKKVTKANANKKFHEDIRNRYMKYRFAREVLMDQALVRLAENVEDGEKEDIEWVPNVIKGIDKFTGMEDFEKSIEKQENRSFNKSKFKHSQNMDKIKYKQEEGKLTAINVILGSEVTKEVMEENERNRLKRSEDKLRAEGVLNDRKFK